MNGRRSIRRLAAPLAIVVALGLVACSDAPSGAEVATAVAKVQSAPVPEGASPTPELPSNLGAGAPVTGTDVFRSEQCSDGSCPSFTRYFTTTRHATMDEACAALGEYVRVVGGEPPSACPPDNVGSATSVDGNGNGNRYDMGQVLTEGSDVADFVRFGLSYATKGGAWDGTTPVELTLGVGVQLGTAG